MQKIGSLAAALVSLIVVSRAPATVMPAEKSDTISLDGTWRFKIEQPGDLSEHGSIGKKLQPIIVPQHLEPFQELSYKEDSSWHNLKVPANWEMYGFSPATYGQPDNAIGIYREWFKVPADWKGRLVKLNFDGVQNGAEIYLNGQPVNVNEPAWGRSNYHEGGWDAFQADLTPAVKFGEKNLLAIRVYKNTKSVDMDTGDFFFLGGIHRPVTLFSVPQAHIEDYSVRTTLLDGGKAKVAVLVKLGGGMPSGQVVMQLKGESPVQSVVNAQGNIEIDQTLDQPRLWSAEHPNLYEMSLDLKDADGKTIEHVEKKIGVREIEIKNGIFMVNNMPVKLTGMCRHDVYPTLGTACDDMVWKKDISEMKAANVNAIRTSHYPYGSGFYDLCDEMGMYVADEMAAVWVPTNTPELTPAFKQHARELVERDKNHPSVIIWAVGNENGKGMNNKIAADQIKEIDPTRPRLVSWQDADEGNVELDDRHYTTPEGVEKLAKLDRRSQYPITFLENPNVWDERNGADYGSLDLWGYVMKREWDVIWKAEHVPGSFLWEWSDRAIANPGPVHLYDYDPKTGIELAKVKGITDPYRTPRADYFQVKMAYAPIQVDPKVSMTDSGVTLHVFNHYSFTNLSELKTTWKLMDADKEVGRGNFEPHGDVLGPWSEGNVTVNLPSEKLAKADALQISFEKDGVNVATYQLVLKEQPRPTLLLNAGDTSEIHFPHVNLVATAIENNSTGWRSAVRDPAHLENIQVQTNGGAPGGAVDEETLYKMPLASVRSMDADLVLANDMKAEAPRRKRKGKNRPAGNAGTVGGNVGHVHVDVNNGKFTYHMEWTSGPVDIQELGWAFELPANYDHFSWNRQSLWSWYPSTHIGRPAGTATPDSAKQDITKLTRPDAFDFNSTKYFCNWAKLTDSSGKGLGVNFAADDLENCRGDFAGNDLKLVVNKYCCPPQDLSTNVVPDFCVKTKKGMNVDGAFEFGMTGENAER